MTALAFGSSTASTISAQAYRAAEALRQELIGAARARELDAALEQRDRDHQARHPRSCGAADLAGVEVVLTPSGTDGEYAALHLARAGPDRPIVNLVIAPGGDRQRSAGSSTRAGISPRLTPSGAAALPGHPDRRDAIPT